MIRDSNTENNILSILKTPEAALLSFGKYIENEQYCKYLEIVKIHTNEFGAVLRTELIRSYSKVSNHMIEYKKV